MRIAVLGSGSVGAAISRAAKRAGHDLTVASDTAESAAALGESLGVETTTSLVDAAADADVVVIAVRLSAINDVATQIAEAVAGKVVIDATNPVKGELSGLVTTEMSTAELVQQQLPHAEVVKAFNTVLTANPDNPEADGVPLDLFVAGDAEDAKTQVLGFLEQIGYHPIDAGPLVAARDLEAMASLNISLNASNGWSWLTGWKLLGPAS